MTYDEAQNMEEMEGRENAFSSLNQEPANMTGGMTGTIANGTTHL
jgi:hypothetical protein